MDNSSGYYQDWTFVDMITFNRNILDEKLVICHWVDQGILCTDSVKGKDFKAHLHNRHGITSDAHPYTCLWDECIGPSMKKSSLERHIKEQHIPFRWACPKCEQTFTRERTLMEHIGRSPGHA